MTTPASFRLDGRIAVVTGGLGHIGSAIVAALAAAGARVVVLDVAKSRWAEMSPELGKAVSFECCDVGQPATAAKTVAELDDELGGIDIWVNSAYPRSSGWGDAKIEETPASWRQNVESQLESNCLFSEAIAKRMAARGRGAIISVSSIYGVVAPDFSIYGDTSMTTPAAYAAIKGGIIAHSRHLASRYGRHGVRVNTICPGGVAAGQPEKFVDAYGRRTMLGRLAAAEEIAAPTVFLCSDESSYITGATLMVDGGLTAL